MNLKELAIIGGGIAAVSKFYFGHDNRTAAILGVVAIVVAGLSDNIAGTQKA